MSELPDHSVVVRFDFPDLTAKRANELWIIFDGERTEVCRTNPGSDEDLVVTADVAGHSSSCISGRIEWIDALRTGDFEVVDAMRLLPRRCRRGTAVVAGPPSTSSAKVVPEIRRSVRQALLVRHQTRGPASRYGEARSSSAGESRLRRRAGHSLPQRSRTGQPVAASCKFRDRRTEGRTADRAWSTMNGSRFRSSRSARGRSGLSVRLSPRGSRRE